MHMADALLSPAVAGTMYVASAAVAGLSVLKLKKEEKLQEEPTFKRLPTMAVMSALVFAGQMINYTIPGTGSSGHICGGLLLTALLGPYAAFLSMICVLLIQCLFFADGGLMALGANIWNMAFYGCFVGYFLIFRPIMKTKLNTKLKLIIASVTGCILTLQMGAFSVVLETSLSGITDLPFKSFVLLMQPIHLAIGLVEGLATSLILVFVHSTSPDLIKGISEKEVKKSSFKITVLVLVLSVAVIGGGFSLLASGNPDGLEWALFGNTEYSESVTNMGLDEEDYGNKSSVADKAEAVQEKTSFLPDYAFASDSENPLGTAVSGILGSLVVAVIAAGVCFAGGFFRKKKLSKTN
ncbi:MAG: energy-coupling factor ABC transporter permease [Clostridiales bacterium]|nr:energy-coupling factor ABC transporter permease [Clostridiales bacterium]